MENVAYWLVVVGKAVLGTMIVALLYYMVAGYLLVDWLAYRKAKKEIYEFMDSYKKRCTGNNRFLVTVETLQDSFREYNTNVIKRVWSDMINDKMIVIDPYDGEWCIR